MFRRAADEDDDLFDPRPSRLGRAAGRALGRPLRGVGRASRAAVGAAGRTTRALLGGWTGRRGRDLLWGLPALAAGAAFAGLAATAGVRARALDEDYRLAADAAFDADDPAAANLYYRRLAELDGGSPRTRFRLAETYDGLGQADAAADLLAGLTPDSGGYPPAHKALAERLLDPASAGGVDGGADGGAGAGGPDAPPDPRRVAAAHRHLLLARRGDPADTDVAVRLAQLYVDAGAAARALPLLTEVAPARPELHLDAGLLAARLGEGAAARRSFEAAAAHFAGVVGDDPADAPARRRWATCLVNLGRLDDAAAVLAAGAGRDRPAFAPLLAEVRTLQYDAVTKAGGAPALRLALLREALRLNPAEVRALVRLIAFADGGGKGGASAAEAAELLRGLLAAGEVPAAAHLALGTRAWAGEDEDAAVFHLERAYALDPSLGPVANNLAYVLAARDAPDLDRALRLMNAAVDRWPDVPDYRDTRGQILHRLGRDAEALDDLERALAGGVRTPETHRTLAAVYDGLGRPELAARHRELAAAPGGDAADAGENPPAADIAG